MHELKTGEISFAAISSLAVLILAASLAVSPVSAMLNPSAVYCTVLGYQYSDRVAADGSMTGYCLLPNNQSVDAWQFFQGKVAQNASYCVKQGYQIRTVTDPAVCPVLISDTCAVCDMPNGSSVEVTKLMKLDFREKICNDLTCCDPNTESTCSLAETTPAFPFNSYVILLIVVIILLAGVIYFITKRKKNTTVGQKEK